MIKVRGNVACTAVVVCGVFCKASVVPYISLRFFDSSKSLPSLPSTLCYDRTAVLVLLEAR